MKKNVTVALIAAIILSFAFAKADIQTDSIRSTATTTPSKTRLDCVRELIENELHHSDFSDLFVQVVAPSLIRNFTFYAIDKAQNQFEGTVGADIIKQHDPRSGIFVGFKCSFAPKVSLLLSGLLDTNAVSFKMINLKSKEIILLRR